MGLFKPLFILIFAASMLGYRCVYAAPKLIVANDLKIEVFAEVPNARQMVMSKEQTLFVGTRRLTKVFAVPKATTKDKRTPITIVSGLNMPAGVALDQQGHLYIAATHEIKRLKFADKAVKASRFVTETVTDQLPDHDHHGWKHIEFSPQGKLVVPVGMPCNVCLPNHEFQGKIMALDLSTGSWSELADGVRNSLGVDWRPNTGRLWFSDNGRDWLGDDLPYDEINLITKPDQHFGFPYYHGNQLAETDTNIVASRPKKTVFTEPAVRITAHSAPLGIHFYRGKHLPKRFHGALFVALHGSWNRSTPSGYLVMAYWFDDNGVLQKQEPLVEGFLSRDSKTLGRPTDIIELEDGSVLISDDHGGRIWQLTSK